MLTDPKRFESGEFGRLAGHLSLFCSTAALHSTAVLLGGASMWKGMGEHGDTVTDPQKCFGGGNDSKFYPYKCQGAGYSSRILSRNKMTAFQTCCPKRKYLYQYELQMP